MFKSDKLSQSVLDNETETVGEKGIQATLPLLPPTQFPQLSNTKKEGTGNDEVNDDENSKSSGTDKKESDKSDASDASDKESSGTDNDDTKKSGDGDDDAKDDANDGE
jgi:hypothetical protein